MKSEDAMEAGAAVGGGCGGKPALAAAAATTKRRRLRCCIAVAATGAALFVVVALLAASLLHTMHQLRDDLPRTFYGADATADLHGAKTAMRVQPAQQLSGYHSVSVSSASCTVSRGASGDLAAPLATLQLTETAHVVVASSSSHPATVGTTASVIAFTVSDVDARSALWTLTDAFTPLWTSDSSRSSSVELAVDCDLGVDILLLGVVPVRFSTAVKHQFPVTLNSKAPAAAATFTGTLTVALPAVEYAFGDARAPSATVGTPALAATCSQAIGGCSVAPSSAAGGASAALVVYTESPTAIAGPLTCRRAPTFECGLFATAAASSPPGTALSALLGEKHDVVLFGPRSFSTSPRPSAPPASDGLGGGGRRLATSKTDDGADADCVQTLCYTVDVDDSVATEWCGSVEAGTGKAADGSFSTRSVTRVLEVLPELNSFNGTFVTEYYRELTTQTMALSYAPNGGAPTVALEVDAVFNDALVFEATLRSAVATPAAAATTAGPAPAYELALTNDVSVTTFGTAASVWSGAAPLQINTTAAGQTTAAFDVLLHNGGVWLPTWSLQSTFRTVITPDSSSSSASPSYTARYDGTAAWFTASTSPATIYVDSTVTYVNETVTSTGTGSLAGNSSLVLGSAAEGGGSSAHFLDLDWQAHQDWLVQDGFNMDSYSSFSIAVDKANLFASGKLAELAGSVSGDAQEVRDGFLADQQTASTWSAGMEMGSGTNSDGNTASTVSATAAMSCPTCYESWSWTLDAPVVWTQGTDPEMMGLMDMQKLAVDVNILVDTMDGAYPLLSASLRNKLDSSATAVVNTGSFTLQQPAHDASLVSMQVASSIEFGAGAASEGGFSSVHSAQLAVTDPYDGATTAYDLEVAKLNVNALASSADSLMSAVTVDLSSSLTSSHSGGPKQLLFSVTATDEWTTAAAGLSDGDSSVNTLSTVVSSGSTTDPGQVLRVDLVSDFDLAAPGRGASSHVARVDVSDVRVDVALDYNGSVTATRTTQAFAGRAASRRCASTPSRPFFDCAVVPDFAANVSLRGVVDGVSEGPLIASSHNVSFYTPAGGRTDFNMTRLDILSGADLVDLRVSTTTGANLGDAVLLQPTNDLSASLSFPNASIRTVDLYRGSAPPLGPELLADGFTVAGRIDWTTAAGEHLVIDAPLTWTPVVASSRLPAGHGLAQVSLDIDVGGGNTTHQHYAFSDSVETATDGSSFFSLDGNGMCTAINTLSFSGTDSGGDPSWEGSGVSYFLLSAGADAGGLSSWHSGSLVSGDATVAFEAPKLNAFVGSQLLRVAHSATLTDRGIDIPIYESDLSITLQPDTSPKVTAPTASSASTTSLLTTPWAKTAFALNGFNSASTFSLILAKDASPVISISAPLSVSPVDGASSGGAGGAGGGRSHAVAFDVVVDSYSGGFYRFGDSDAPPCTLAELSLRAAPSGVSVDLGVLADTGDAVFEIGFNTTASQACAATTASDDGVDPCLTATCLGESTCNDIDTPSEVLEEFFDCDCSGCDATTTTTTTTTTTATVTTVTTANAAATAAAATASPSSCATRACGSTTCSVLAQKTGSSYAALDKAVGCTCSGCDAVLVKCEWWACEE